MILASRLGGIIGERAAAIVPYVIMAALVAVAFLLGRCDGVNREQARQTIATEKANSKAVERDADAKVKASEERATDTATIDAKQKDQTDAIKGETDRDIRRNAACQRVRAARGDQAARAAGC